MQTGNEKAQTHQVQFITLIEHQICKINQFYMKMCSS